MSKWYTYNEENADIDVNSGDVDIWLGSDYDGNIYLAIPFADVLALAESVKEASDDR